MFTAVPPAGVSVIPLMVTANDRIEVPGGGVNGPAARVRLTVAVPVPQLLVQRFFEPLQAARDNAVSKRRGKSERVLMRFMWPPRRWICVRPPERKTLTIPLLKCNAAIV